MKQAVWLSGWSAPAEIWRAAAEECDGVFHRFVSFEDCHSKEAILEKTMKTMDEAGSGAVLIGWSMGGMVALELAARFPERTEAVFAVAAPGRFVRRTREEPGWDERVLGRMITQLRKDPAAVLAAFDRQMFTEGEGEAGWLDRWRAECRASVPPVSALVAGLEFLRDFSVLETADRIRCPVFLLAGERDEICPAVGVEELHRCLPDSRLNVWKGTGHLPFWVNPSRFREWFREGWRHVC
jgi:pimeloyl-[acyl-carrier protein] methyl ester esterase